METLVLVMTDVQGSTRLWQNEPVAMDAAMTRHHELLHGAVAEHEGWRPVDQGEGDAVFAAFRSPTEAIAAVAQVQRALAAEPWPTSVPLQVRIGVHVGEVFERAGNLFGDPVNRCARLRGLGAGGQILLSAPVYELVRDKLPTGVTVSDLGEHRMKDLTRSEHVWQLDLDGLPSDFPPLTSLDRVRHNLPVQATPFIGREAELAQLVAVLFEHRLVTLTGFGGMGKTRTAIQAAAELLGHPLADEVWFVDLSEIDDPSIVPARVAEATSVTYDSDPTAALVAAWASTSVLLVLDNLEQVLGCASFVADLLARCGGVRVLATSREALRVRAEQVFPLAPMTVPTDVQARDLATLGTFEAVRLFVDRARAVKPDFAVTNDNAPSVAAVCARLDGHPLALELAAARLRVMSVDALQTRLDSALTMLAGGSRDMPERHQTLRATIAWSYQGLEEDEQLLLARMSCLPGAADFEMVEAVCGDDLDVLTSLEVLVDRSLVRTTEGELGETRYGLLVSIRDYAHEQLDPTQVDQVSALHTGHVVGLAAGADQDRGWEDVALVRRELTHVRAALGRLRSDDDTAAYIALVDAVAVAFCHNGFAVEAKTHLDEALARDPSARERASLLAALIFAVGYADKWLIRDFLEAARAVGEPVLLASALIRSLTAVSSLHALHETVAELESLIGGMALPDAEVRTGEMLNLLGSRLRYVDPAGIRERLLQHLAKPDDGQSGVIRIRLARILLDHGMHSEARAALGERNDPADVHGIVGWYQGARAERGRLLAALGDPATGAVLAQDALDVLVEARIMPYFGAVSACSCYAAAGEHEAVVRAVDAALAIPTLPGNDASLTWRRAHALLLLGQRDQSRRGLASAREILADDELGGPRELLGCLITEALIVHENDPARAALLLGSVAGHRETNLGRWVLPHSTDRDANYLRTLLLPDQQAAFGIGLALKPQDYVRTTPL